MVMVAVAATKLSPPCVPLFEFDIVLLMFSPPVEEILVESDIVILYNIVGRINQDNYQQGRKAGIFYHSAANLRPRLVVTRIWA